METNFQLVKLRLLPTFGLLEFHLPQAYRAWVSPLCQLDDVLRQRLLCLASALRQSKAQETGVGSAEG